MLTIHRATFYINNSHLESLSRDWEFHGGIHDKSFVCIV